MTEDANEPLGLLIAGGGIAAVEAMLATRALAGDRVRIDLLAPETELAYRPRSVLEPFRAGERRRYPLGSIARDVDATHHRDALASVDVEGRTARTVGGDELAYDALLVATGARPVPALERAVTFTGEHPEELGELLERARSGDFAGIAFVVPPGVAWPLPLYELALMTSYESRAIEAPNLRLELITPEEEPLGVFGRPAAEAIRRLLRERAITLRTATYAEEGDAEGELVLHPGGEGLRFDRVVSLPRLAGSPIDGLPADEAGFIPVDHQGAIPGAPGCFAAGDATSFPIKQGGIATQQADAAAEAIAARAGAPVSPREFRPVLRGVLLTSSEPQHLRAAISGGQGETSIASSHALWWPSNKVAGRFLAPYLAGVDASTEGALRPGATGALDVDLELHDIRPIPTTTEERR